MGHHFAADDIVRGNFLFWLPFPAPVELDYPQTLLLRIPPRVCASARSARAVAHACSAVLHQMPVALLHAPVFILARNIYHLIGLPADGFVSAGLPPGPSLCLGKAGQNEYQPDAGVFPFQA